MRILIPLDGTAEAERALVPAVQLMRHADVSDRLILVHVQTSDDMTGEASVIEHVRLPGRHPDLDPPQMAMRFRSGDPADEICAVAREDQADVIIIAGSERMWQRHRLADGLCDQVIRKTHLPVLLVQPTGETFPDIGRFEPFTILVPLDGSTLAEAAIEPAVLLARRLHGSIRLLRVLPQVDESIEQAALISQAAMEYLSEVHARLEARGVTAHRSLAHGKPEYEIIAETQRHSIDLIALATHARRGLDEMTYGSVYRQVAHHTHLPMLVVHPMPTPARDLTSNPNHLTRSHS